MWTNNNHLTEFVKFKQPNVDERQKLTEFVKFKRSNVDEHIKTTPVHSH